MAATPRVPLPARIAFFSRCADALELAHPADAETRRAALYAVFGRPEWHFLRDAPHEVRAWMLGPGSLVPLASADYAAVHVGPNAYQLRPDYAEAVPRPGGRYTFELAEGATADALLADALETLPPVGPNERVRVLWLAARKDRARDVVAPLCVDDTLVLAGAGGALVAARLLLVRTSRRYVVAALREFVPALRAAPAVAPAAAPAGAARSS